MGDAKEDLELLGLDLTIGKLLAMPLQEMPRPRKALGRIAESLQDQINEHLIMLLVVRDRDEAHAHWAGEVAGWLFKIARIRVDGKGRPEKRRFYYDRLWGWGFSDDTDATLRAMIQDVGERYPLRQDVQVGEIARRLEAFHSEFAALCARGVPANEVRPHIGLLLDRFRGAGGGASKDR